MTAPGVVVTDRPERHRYEVALDGHRVGLVTYRLDGDVITFIHTEVDDAVSGQGIAGALARYALDDARRRGLGVVPQCPYIAHFIDTHPGYSDLVRR